jgi:hypothetical protein
MVEGHGHGEEQRVEKREEGHTPRRPGTYLAGMAGQCPRGQQDATRGRLHRSTAGSTTTVLPPACSLTQRSSHRSTTGVVEEDGEASHRGCPELADPEGRDHPDLLGEEAADETAWWR